jgi:ubiquinone/menaquinone biosynthesis C-methylase UbiE
MKRLSPLAGYDLYAGNYRKDHPYLDTFMEGAESASWIRALDDLLAEREQVVAVDAGCGDGRTLGRWARRLEKHELTERVELWGLDFSPKMIEAGRGRVKGVKWEVIDVGNLEAIAAWSKANGPADLVSAFFLVVHFDRPERFFKCMAGLLSPGGRLVMNTIPQPKAPELRASGKPVMIEAFDHTAEEMIFCGKEAGFELLNKEDFTEANQLISTLLEWRK